MQFQLYCLTTLALFAILQASPYPKYKGCFKDGDPRDLPQKVFSRGGSVRGCVKKCRALGFMNAGVQFSYLCFCGDSSGRYGRLPDAACNSPCRKKRDKICGGEWANAVYDTGYRDEKYKPKKRKPVKTPKPDNSTSADVGSGSAAQELVTSGSSADGMTSAQEPPAEETKGVAAPKDSPSPLVDSAAQLIASLGQEPAVQGPAVQQQANVARGVIPPAPTQQAQAAPNSEPAGLTPEQMLSAL